MAGQRRREPRGHRSRCRSRLGRLALALPLLLIGAGCGDPAPTEPRRPLDDTGTSGGDTPVGRLVGSWRATLIVEVPGDVQTWTTTWRFDPDGACLHTQEVRSAAEGVRRITERPCSFVADDFEITISYTGGATLVLDYAFPSSSSDVLTLDGFEYERVGP
jgi:hypothetical protein